MSKVAYLDSSAIVKLIAREAETAALRAFLESWPDRASSALSRIEVGRAMLRSSPTAQQRRLAESVFDHVVLLQIDAGVISLAEKVLPSSLRSLDAIHLASAQSIGSDLGAVITYDERLASAASALDFEVASPS